MLALLLGAAPGITPPRVFRGRSLKRLQIWITDALVERPRSSLIGVHHEPKSLSPFESKKPRHWRAPGLLHSGKLMTSVLTRPRPASKAYHSLTLASVARPQLADLKGAVEADARMARPRRRLIVWENVGHIGSVLGLPKLASQHRGEHWVHALRCSFGVRKETFFDRHVDKFML